jgi:aminocarboxymuconate-semialdehyde decarboxylase
MGIGLHGVEIGSNVNGHDLDEPEFRPFWQKAADTGAFVFMHPMVGPAGRLPLPKYYLSNFIGNPTDTAIAAGNLIFSGIFDEIPGITLCLAHGGGTFPWLLGRWEHGRQVRPEARLATRPIMEYARELYVDNLVHDDRIATYLIDLLGADRVLIGSDHPYDMGCLDPVERVTRLDIDNQSKDLILGHTAARLLRI